MLIMAAESFAKNCSLSASIGGQSFYHIGKKVLSAYGNRHDLVNRQSAMEGAEPVSFHKIFRLHAGKRGESHV